jgi:hypothetical protein
MEAWIPVSLPRGLLVPGGYQPDELTDLVHEVRRGIPGPAQPDYERLEGDALLKAIDAHDRELEKWQAADIAERHPFRAMPADLVLNPKCPVCGADVSSGVDPLPSWDLAAYRRVIVSWSYKAMRSFVTPGWTTRGREDLHLDHIVPVELGLQMGIAEDVIACPVNLQEITSHANLSKGTTPGMSIDALLAAHDAWCSGHPDWVEMIAHRRRTNAWPRSQKQSVPRRYASDDERDAAHRERMRPVYALWDQGFSLDQIASTLGLPRTTLQGRIQLDKKYRGDDSPFRKTRKS